MGENSRGVAEQTGAGLLPPPSDEVVQEAACQLPGTHMCSRECACGKLLFPRCGMSSPGLNSSMGLYQETRF